MNQSEITKLISVLETFFNSAPGRKQSVSVTYEDNSHIERKGDLYITDEVGVEDELERLREEGFIIYTVGGYRPSKYEDTKTKLTVKVPDTIPDSID